MSIRSFLLTSNYNEVQLPDSHTSNSNNLFPGDDFVVSRTSDGSVLSRYGDNEWNVRPYCPQSITTYKFSTWCHNTADPLAQSIIQEMKQIQYARMFLYKHPRKVNSIRLIEIRKLAKFAFKNRVTLTSLLSDKSMHAMLISSFSELDKASIKKNILYVLRELYEIHCRHPKFRLSFSTYDPIKVLERIANTASLHSKSYRQTKLIPSRLYAAFICGLNDKLETFVSNAPAIIELIEGRSKDKFYAMPPSHAIGYKKSVSWKDAIDELGLTSLFNSELIKNFIDLNGYLYRTQIAARLFIHFFTGMRANECRHLPADTYTTIEANEFEITVLKGYTSKQSGQNQTATYWVTSPVVEKAILAARHIGRASSITNRFDDSDPSIFPLFPLVDASRESSAALHYPTAPVTSSFQIDAMTNLARSIPGCTITEDDIAELEQFDGFRDWRNDKSLQIGKPWPISSHQCRRSLAVYSARSGTVSLGSLAMQFKHLTQIMSSYYRKNGAFAVNFIKSDDQQGLADEIELEFQKHAFMQYNSEVINSTSRLLGGEGNRIQVARDKHKPLIITTDRALTEKKFLKGEMTYKEGPLGGCTNLEPCDKISFLSVTACLDCKNSILDEKKSGRKISYAIRNMEVGREKFSESSPFYKQITSEIEAIHAKVARAGLTTQVGEYL